MKRFFSVFTAVFALSLVNVIAVCHATNADEIRFDEAEIEALVKLSDIHDAADSGQRLIAWSPLAFLSSNLPAKRKVGEKLSADVVKRVAAENAVIVTSTDWSEFEGIVTAAVGLKRIELLAAKRVCLEQAARKVRTAPNRKFWQEMANHYEDSLSKLK